MSNVVVIGNGGREHALAYALGRSPDVQKVYVLPGNPGMNYSPKIESYPCSLSDFTDLTEKILQLQADLVVIGPELPLTLGLAGRLRQEGLNVCGPSATAAALEGSKIFSKEFMEEFNIPTAKSYCFNSYEEAKKFVQEYEGEPLVVKADSLAAGKGVVVSKSKEECLHAIEDFMLNPKCVVKSEKILLEERLEGKEVSAFALCDGENFIPLGYVCDYKRLKDNDEGPNTGGMGCYTPKDWPSEKIKNQINEKVFSRVLDGMKKRGHPYQGILFAGLMISDDGQLNVIEFNVRFGDPEAQTLLPLFKGDLFDLIKKSTQKRLHEVTQRDFLEDKTSVHVVMSSQGYPTLDEKPMLLEQEIFYEKDYISGNNSEDIFLTFAGIKRKGDELINTGGRVLGVSALGKDKNEARLKCYNIINKIKFNGAFWREDIGL